MNNGSMQTPSSGWLIDMRFAGFLAMLIVSIAGCKKPTPENTGPPPSDNTGPPPSDNTGPPPSDNTGSSSQHLVTIQNNCDQQVWLAEFGSTSVPPANWALAPTCTTSSICAQGQTCSNGACTCASSSDCAFGAPAGTPTATCDTSTTPGRCVSSTQVSLSPGWSGRFWPRTGCSGSSSKFVCQTGQCGPAAGGNIDCTEQNATANLATLFELTLGGTSGMDNYDVSLVSGYNIPVQVTVQLPTDTLTWSPSTSYAAGAQITQTVGQNTFNFTNSGSAGTSGTTTPAFPSVRLASVSDGDLTWVNTGPVCQTSGCVADLLGTCPAPLQVPSSGSVVACDAPANACVPTQSSCHSDLSFYQCQNNSGATDLFGNVLTLQSPNAGTFVCFSSQDCPAGTTCQLNPTFATSFTLPASVGVCTPVAQNGGCQPGDDGKPCPIAPTYPFVEYQCATLANVKNNAQVCVPPTTSGVGDLWWNADNWTATKTSCTSDAGCSSDGGSSQKCLAAPVMGGAAQCTASNGPCYCYNAQTCSSTRGTNDGCSQPNACLNKHGVPDGKTDNGKVVNCTAETCYCGPQGVYSGTCGPTNPGWNAAALRVGTGSAGWPSIFKTACPVAYAYQFDDPSSNWSCPNTADQLVNYTLTFCPDSGTSL